MADLEALKQALAVSPNNIPLMLLLANGHLENFSLDEGKELFQRALEIEPNHLAAQLGVIQVLDLEGKTSEAIVRLEQLCAQSPNHAPAWMQFSKLLLKDENAREARDAYDRAVRIDSSLAEADLLKRIESAGGDPSPSSSDEPSNVRASSSGGWQAGAMYDPENGEDSEGMDFFGDEISEMEDLVLEFSQKADTNFSGVGGMEALKEEIRMKIIYPLQNKELFAAYGKKAGGGVLLYGPPGCGKTMISRATAGEIEANFLSIGLHQILDMWIGKSEEKLHGIFELARKHAPSVLFFDEVDAIAADRKDLKGSGGRTLINQFLAELDGSIADNDGVLVLGATNAPWHLDSAFLRPGRFDRLIFVPPPDEPARTEIIKIMADGKPVSDFDPAGLAKRTKNFSGADIKAMYDLAVEDALSLAMKKGSIVPVTSKDLARTAKRVKPSTLKWFDSAKNYALYANQSGFYDDVLEYLGIKK